jgi:hypothetical protein
MERLPEDSLSVKDMAESLWPYAHFVSALAIGIHSHGLPFASGAAGHGTASLAFLKHSARAALTSIFAACAGRRCKEWNEQSDRERRESPIIVSPAETMISGRADAAMHLRQGDVAVRA